MPRFIYQLLNYFKLQRKVMENRCPIHDEISKFTKPNEKQVTAFIHHPCHTFKEYSLVAFLFGEQKLTT